VRLVLAPDVPSWLASAGAAIDQHLVLRCDHLVQVRCMKITW
jgi:hypothetical protein